MGEAATAVSAPGKVFLAGGYLVLDRKYNALVFGLDTRIHVHVQALSGASHDTIVVRSPQFKEAEWRYTTANAEAVDGGIQLTQIQDASITQSTNPFVETTLCYVLTYLSHLQVNQQAPLLITILADNDYYSATEHAATAATNQNVLFSKFGVTLKNAHKTGLGSSAALVTALTTALFVHHRPKLKTNDLEEHQDVIHNLAQAAHCAAQGKVGSGFDIAAAVYGSCLYRRFTPSILESLGESCTPGFGDRLYKCVQNLDPGRKWDSEVQKSAVQVPKSLRLVMCDVDCGSQTPGMVKKVLSWRKQNQAEADLLWGAIQKGTDDVCEELKRLSFLDKVEDHQYDNLRDIILTIRSLIREMSEKSGVPVEPKVQTELLDACSAIRGVIGGVVPGAGGYDAIALLVKNDPAVLEKLQQMLERWESTAQEDSSEKIGNVRLLAVRDEFEGGRGEATSRYEGWI